LPSPHATSQVLEASTLPSSFQSSAQVQAHILVHNQQSGTAQQRFSPPLAKVAYSY
jgi:hypothetical protein